MTLIFFWHQAEDRQKGLGLRTLGIWKGLLICVKDLFKVQS